MRKTYFFETKPSAKMWEREIDDINGKIVPLTPWVESEEQNRQNLNNKINEISDWTEDEFRDFTKFLRELNYQ